MNRFRFNPSFVCEFCGCVVPVSKTEFVYIPRYDKMLQVCESCADQHQRMEPKGGKK